MFPAFPVGRIFGVQIRVHALFLVLIAFMVFGDWPSLGMDREQRLILIGILWGSVLLHELGHSLVAKHYKVQVLDITFWPLGGMARFVNFPSDPHIELPIAFGGPAVNFAIALALVPWIGIEGSWAKTAWMINLALGIFNLVPAFPMDGGRVLRALLAFRFDYLKATEIAARLARWLAFGLFLAAFLVEGQFWAFLLISIFIWFSATQELWSVRIKHATRGGNPFLFWQSFGTRSRQQNSSETPSPTKTDDPEKTQKELESFKGSLDEFFQKEKDPDDSK